MNKRFALIQNRSKFRTKANSLLLHQYTGLILLYVLRNVFFDSETIISLSNFVSSLRNFVL